jgi:hypothetical protein
MKLKRNLAGSLSTALSLLAVAVLPVSAQYGYPLPSPTPVAISAQPYAMQPAPMMVPGASQTIMMVPVVVSGAPLPYYPVTGVSTIQAQPIVTAAAPGTVQFSSMSQGEIDRLLAAAETSEEVRIVLSRYDRWAQVKADPTLKQFLRERFTAPELAAGTTLTREYRAWLVETLIERGTMIDQAGVIPNFRLLPAVQAPSWTAIWNRSFAPYLQVAKVAGSARVATFGHPHAHLRAAPFVRSAILARFVAGTEVTVLGHEGGWVRVSAAGMTGYLLSTEVTRSGERNVPYSGPESVIHYQNMPSGIWEGYDTPYGWVYPAYTQSVGAARTMGAGAETR